LDAAGRQAAVAAGTTAGFAIAFQIAGKATRDALFLSIFDVTSLPAMIAGAAGTSVLLALAAAWALTRFGPRWLVPGGFVASAVLLLAESWLLQRAAPTVAILYYLHYAGFGAVLVSGLWSIVSERFDPRTARRQLGRIAAAGSLGGVMGGLVAARVGAVFTVPTMLPLLAGFHLAAAVSVAFAGRGIAAPLSSADEAPMPSQIAARMPYLRMLILLVLLTSLSEVMLDYVFKAQAKATFVTREDLLRFFAWYWTGVGLIAFTIQSAAARSVLRRFGLARTVGSLPAATALASGGAVLLGGFIPVVAARSTEALMRAGLFRVGYEMLFAPLLPREKRATKAVIDVGVMRAGDILGAGVVRLTLLVPGALRLLLALAAIVAGSAVAVIFRLRGRYAEALEQSLAARATGDDGAALEDEALQSAMRHTVGAADFSMEISTLATTPRASRVRGERPPSSDAHSERAMVLRSRDPDRVREALASGRLSGALVETAIPLLSWDAVAPVAVRALRRAGPEATGVLVHALLDPDEEFTTRRRIPLVLASYPSQPVADGLVAGLSDQRFEVRFRCGLALHRIRTAMPALRVDRDRILAAALREVSVDRRVWESHRLLDQQDDETWSPMFDEMLRDRANRGLQHVFTLLALILPPAPLQLAYRGLHTSDRQVRGTALEYLEATLPPEIRKALWPFLEVPASQSPALRSRDEILHDLLASEATIALDLGRLRRKSD
jgi:AAA family ATP:ADP antiporter